MIVGTAGIFGSSYLSYNILLRDAMVGENKQNVEQEMEVEGEEDKRKKLKS
ncbi:hypothetical protein [Mycoplasma suis]|uniref:hypothetical protein n=1 Tax=Mycoplasma suis TaxID=57372 RepID=UPI00130536DF|nr:hypothetical protein [Mycoplasma suis]